MNQVIRALWRERIQHHVKDITMPELKNNITDSAIGLHEEFLSEGKIPQDQLVEALNLLEEMLLQETARQLKRELA